MDGVEDGGWCGDGVLAQMVYESEKWRERYGEPCFWDAPV